MSKEKHGLIGKIIKISMIIVFLVIGVLNILAGAHALKQASVQKWLAICYIVFGACLLTSPFFFSNKRSGIFWIVKFAMVIIFTAIGVLYIVGNSIALAKNEYAQPDRWIPIVGLVFGCLLLTSPYFLKKQ